MCSEENLDEYGKNIKNDSDVIQKTISKRKYHSRRVSFPENDTDLVTGYLEPVNPLRLAINVDKTELLKAYELSCQRHRTPPIKSIVEQIQSFDINNERIHSLKLDKITFTYCGCESLEEIFKRIQFLHIDLSNNDLRGEIAYVLFEMFEYYESTVHLRISNNYNIDVRGWQACSRYLKKSNTLEELEIQDNSFTEFETDCLFKPLTLNKHLQVLKLESCNLNGNSLRVLVGGLTYNKTLRELYLSDNKLGIFEATLLGTLLKLNRSIQVLDLSNNQIQDAGVNHLVVGLCNQIIFGRLEMLVLWNNLLTDTCSSHIDQLLKEYEDLTFLNMGFNALSDSFVKRIKESLKCNKNLLMLGLQASNLTCASAIILADVLKTNSTLERIDLRENDIWCTGLQALSDSLDTNRSIHKINIYDSVPKEISDEYRSLSKEINAKCEKNKSRTHFEPPRLNSRKISLTCQTLMQEQFAIPSFLSEPKGMTRKLRSPAPSPIPSPISSPLPILTKSRFSVSRVAEIKGSNVQSPSRFTVLAVSEPPKAVTSNSGAVTVGFHYNSTAPQNETLSSSSESITENIKLNSTTIKVCVTPDQESQMQSVNGCKNKQQKSSAANDDTMKPLSGVEKLLSIFQAPTNVFLKNTQPLVASTNQSDNSRLVPFSNITMNKNMNNTSVNMYPSDTPNPNTESIKENISPEHSLTLSSIKKSMKSDYHSFCALDKDKELKISSDNGGTILCSSSEDSDSGCSGLTPVESCSSSASAVDGVVSDDSVASYTKSSASTASASTPSVSDSPLDLTNNNRWKSTVAVSVTTHDSLNINPK